MPNSKRRDLISVVVPVYCEVDNVQPFYQAISQAIQDQDYDVELIFVNDGSRDGTLEKLIELTEHNPHVIVLNFSRNFGSYAAIEAGFAQAKGDAVMAISIDLQDPPELINEFVPKWREGHEIVWGVRSSRKDPLFKKIFANGFYWFIRKFIFRNFPTKGMDTGLFDKKIIQHYLASKDPHSIPFFIIYAMGFNQCQIPYQRRERLAGESGWPFWKRVKCAIDIFVSFSYVPIRLATFSGIIFSIIAFIYGFILITLRLLHVISLPGWSSLAVLVLFVGGAQLVFLGIISEYIWRINDWVKRRPTYYIMSTHGGEQPTEQLKQKTDVTDVVLTS